MKYLIFQQSGVFYGKPCTLKVINATKMQSFLLFVGNFLRPVEEVSAGENGWQNIENFGEKKSIFSSFTHNFHQ